jgi:hypothetical protein
LRIKINIIEIKKARLVCLEIKEIKINKYRFILFFFIIEIIIPKNENMKKRSVIIVDVAR